MAAAEGPHRPPLLDRVGRFFVFAGLLSVLAGLALDYIQTQQGIRADEGLPVAVEVLHEEPGRWAVLQVSAAYFAARSLRLDPRSLLFWGVWGMFGGWLLLQRRRVMAGEMESEALARQRRLFRLFRRK